MQATQPDAAPYYCTYGIGPISADATGQQLVSKVGGACYTASSSYQDLLYSAYRGAHWPQLAKDGSLGMGYGASLSGPAFSPLPPHRLFAVDYGSSGSPMQPVPTAATQRYFAATKHTLRGDFRRYWLAHGGEGMLGPSISEPFTAPNGDGSGRRYLMQYCANARLEAHPENRDPRYAVELGLLGVESARARGWLTRAPWGATPVPGPRIR